MLDSKPVFFIDANIFLRVLVKEDRVSFEECRQVLELVKTNKIKAVTATLILSEIAWTLKSYYQFPKKRVIEALRSILNLRGLRIIDKYQLQLALDFYELHKVKYIDALVVSIPQIVGQQWKLVSYDRDFDKLKVVRVEPKQVIK